MPETNESLNNAANLVKDVFCYLGEAAYAVLPEGVAHRLAAIEKNFWGGMRWLVDKELEWLDARVAGSDRLREEWHKRRAEQETKNAGNNI